MADISDPKEIKILDQDIEFEVFDSNAQPYGRAKGWVKYQGERYRFQAHYLFGNWSVSWLHPYAPPLAKYQQLALLLSRVITKKCQEKEKKV